MPAGTATVDVTVEPYDDYDVEGDEALTFSLTGGSGGGCGCGGCGSSGSYTLGSPSTASLTIADNDFTAPTFNYMSAPAFSIDENTAPSNLGSVTASDSDPGDTISYSLSGGPFAIDSATGAISATAAPNYESQSSYSLTVTATDTHGLYATQSVTINVINIDEAPSFPQSGYSFSQSENGPQYTTSPITASDPDGEIVTYLLSGSSGASVNTDGSLNLPTFDYEAGSSYSLTLTAWAGLHSASTTITLTIEDLNEAPAFTSTLSTLTLAEDVSVGSAVGSVPASDPDAWQIIVYSISDSRFSIDSGGNITIASPLDFETSNAFGVTVTATDSGYPSTQSASTSFFIYVTDVNEAPIFSSSTFTFSIEELHESPINVSVNAIDPDNSTLSYSIPDNPDSSIFSIDPSTGIITVGQLVYDVASSYTFTVNASDGLLTSFTSVDVDVVINNTLRVDENSANGTVVGTPRSATVTAPTTFAIAAGNNAGAFAINGATGQITVANGTLLNYETVTSFTLTVSIADANNTDTVQVPIQINDVNERPYYTPATATISLNENPANAQVVFGAAAADDDPAGLTSSFSVFTVRYVISASGGAFAIDNQTGVITVADRTKVDFETPPATYTLTVTATDGGGLSATFTLTINVANVQEPVAFAQNPYVFALGAGAGQDALVGNPLAADPDGTAIQYSIQDGNSDGLFKIDAATGKIQVAAASMPTNPTLSYTLTVRATDGGGTTDETTVTINLAPMVVITGDMHGVETSTLTDKIALTFIRTSSDLSAALVVTYQVGYGGAGVIERADFTNPNDLTPAGSNTGTITIPANSDRVELSLYLQADGSPERRERLRITLVTAGQPYTSTNDINEKVELLGRFSYNVGFSNVDIEALDGTTLYATGNTFDPSLADTALDGVDVKDLMQGQIGDCWLLAALASMATNAETHGDIRGMIRDNGDGTASVLFFPVGGAGQWVTVPMTIDRGYAGAKLTYDEDGNSGVFEIWPLIVEKAYAVWKADNWLSIWNGGHETYFWNAVYNENVAPIDVDAMNAAAVLNDIRAALNPPAGQRVKNVGVGSNSNGGVPWPLLNGDELTDNHDLAVIDIVINPAGVEILRLYNPHGRVVEVPVGDFATVIGSVYIR